MYADGRLMIQLDPMSAAGQAITTTGDKLFWAPSQPCYIRQFIGTVTTATTAADPATIALEKRITAGSDTGRVTTGVPAITIPGGTAAGASYYKANLSFLVSPGEQIVLKVTDASAAGAVTFSMLVELSPQVPGNVAAMVASA